MEHVGSERFKNSKLQLFSRLKLKNIFPGEWESIYTGEGIEYATSKPLEPGDDLRDLDLQTLVQTGEEEIILRATGRQRKIYLWVDLSGSMQRFPEMFFSQKPEIRDTAVGLLAFSAWNAYSPVGLCAFDLEVRQFFPAQSGESYCEEIVCWFLDHADEGTRGSADISGALGFLEERISPQSLVLFISDFQDPLFEGNFAHLLRQAAKKFDFIPVVVQDPLEYGPALNHSVVIAVRDSETDRRAEITLTPQKLAEILNHSAGHLAHLKKGFLEVGLEYIVLDSAAIEDCYRTLSSFFEGRRRTRG
jgi:uncharacterized protein (DUF58 family)